MNQQQPPYYNPNPIPTPPPRPPRTWWQKHGLLVGILGGTVLLLSLGIWAAVSAASKLSSNITQATGGFMEAMTTIDESNNQYEYDNLYAICDSDSARFVDFRRKLDELKEATNDLSAEVHRQHLAFSDTLKKEEAGLLDGIVITKGFFIRAGRAEKLRIMTENYSRTVLRMTGEDKSVLDSEYYSSMPVDDDSYSGNSWERRHFAEQPMTAKVTLVGFITDLRTFESNRLDALQLQMEELQYADSTNQK